jgi:hypothetical protein
MSIIVLLWSLLQTIQTLGLDKKEHFEELITLAANKITYLQRRAQDKSLGKMLRSLGRNNSVYKGNGIANVAKTAGLVKASPQLYR